MKTILIPIFTLILVSCSKPTKFQPVPSEYSGVNFENSIIETDSLNLLTYEYLYNGGGVGIGDFNNDGLQDIFFAGNQVLSRAYLNNGNFRFTDITERFEGLANNQWYSGVSVADINGDGLTDIYLTSTGNSDPEKCRNRLWINMGIGKDGMPSFKEMAGVYGIDDPGPSVAAVFFDYNLDGDLDLYVLNSSETERMNTSYFTKITDGSAKNNDRLYRNNGDGTFSDVTIQAGIVYEGYGLGVAVGDVNKDHYPDIYVSNDYITNDLLYINQQDGTFKNEIGKYLSYQTRSSMGNDMADINNDGNPDILTLDMLPESYAKRKQTINGFSYIYYLNDQKFGYEHQYIRNMLHVHNGFMDGEMVPFSEVGQMFGISRTDWSWSGQFADFDNDGDRDLIVTNGYPRDLTDKDWLSFMARNKNSGISQLEIVKMMPQVKIPNIIFENNNGSRFDRKVGWLPDIPSYSYGGAYADLDNDGDLDYVVNNLNDKAFILRNYLCEKSKKDLNSARIKLKGKGNNTQAIGATIEIWSGIGYQFAENFLTRGYASSVEPVIHFGLGKYHEIDSLRVTWPSTGRISLLKDLQAGTLIEIDENNSIIPAVKPTGINRQGAIFERCDTLLDYTHEQTDFADFFLSQKIIPHKFSQIGPCMAKGDINNDGLEDIIIGSTNLSPTTLFLRKGAGFEKKEIKGLTFSKDYTESDLSILDIDNDGDNDVIAVAGGYENKKESEKQENLYIAVAAGYDSRNEKNFRHMLYENRVDSFKKIQLPVPSFLASVIRPCDFNHDGSIDLFIGARVKRGAFPYSSPSWLILNNNGELSVNSSSKLELGMVTDAIWTDFDTDGWEDLLVVREWDTPAILKNNQGKELVLQKFEELESLSGLWYSVVKGDFDRDGDDDYILGNLGENNQFDLHADFSLGLYVIDFELDGVIDPLMTGFWPDQNGRMTEYPVNYLDELIEQSTYFQNRFKNYTSFSQSSIEDIIDANLKKRIQGKLVVNTLSSCILWNDNGKMRWEKLPRELQTAPISRMVVKDLNDDSWPDVIAGGNDYSWEVSTGYFDALKGVVMINKKDGKGFNILSPPQSGLLLNGMVGSLIYFDDSLSLLVAGMNRKRVVVYKHRIMN